MPRGSTATTLQRSNKLSIFRMRVINSWNICIFDSILNDKLDTWSLWLKMIHAVKGHRSWNNGTIVKFYNVFLTTKILIVFLKTTKNNIRDIYLMTDASYVFLIRPCWNSGKFTTLACEICIIHLKRVSLHLNKGINWHFTNPHPFQLVLQTYKELVSYIFFIVNLSFKRD